MITPNPIFYYLFVLLIQSISLPDLHAQWQSMNGPYGGDVRILDQNDQYQFAATTGGLYKSTNAKDWTHVEFTTGDYYDCLYVTALDSQVVAVVIDPTSGIHRNQYFRSENNGNTWIEMQMPQMLQTSKILLTHFGMYAHDEIQSLFWFSPDKGMSWSPSAFPLQGESIIVSTAIDGRIWLSSYGTLWSATSGDMAWDSLVITHEYFQIQQLFAHDSVILALAPYEETLFRSADYGQTWLADQQSLWGQSLNFHFATIDQLYVACLDHFIISSLDYGKTWTMMPSLDYSPAQDMITHDTSILFAGLSRGVFRSDDNGISCYSSSQGIEAANVSHVAIHGNEVLALCNHHGLFNLPAQALTWEDDYDDPLLEDYVYDFIAKDTSLFFISGQPSNNVYRYLTEAHPWKNVSPIGSAAFVGFLIPDTNLYVIDNIGLEKWEPSTESWLHFTFESNGEIIHPRQLAYTSEFTFAGSSKTLFRKLTTSKAWGPILQTDTLPGLEYYFISDLKSIQGTLFLQMRSTLIFGYNNYRILASFNDGDTWTFVDSNFPIINFPWEEWLGPVHNVADVAVTHALYNNMGIVITGTDHIHWKSFNEGLPDPIINDITFDDIYLYAGTSSYGVWRRPLADLIETSVTDISGAEAMQVFPNPSNGSFSFSIALENAEEAVILFSDLSGKIWHSKNQLLTSGYNEVALLSCIPGIHFMSILTRHGVKSYKLMLN